MKQLSITIITLCAVLQTFGQTDKTIFVFGGGISKEFVNHTIELTKKENPQICFLPTANADSPYSIKHWYEITADLDMRPRVLETWISSFRQDKSFEEILLEMDAIIIGGGNTLNLISILKAQEIDLVLKKAYQQGIILAGGSAGSLCWFNSGLTDSRPKKLTVVEGLGFLDYSNNVHHDSRYGNRKEMYYDFVLNNKLGSGYACDEKSGIVFVNGKAQSSISFDADSFSYWVYEKDGIVIEEKLDTIIKE